MKIQICDIENCEEKVKISENDVNGVSELEFYDNIYPSLKYCWARVGILNGEFCPKHRKEIMTNLVERIVKRYEL